MYVYQSFLMRLPDLAASEDIGLAAGKFIFQVNISSHPQHVAVSCVQAVFIAR
jgi:hypothetical protein